MVWHIDVAKYRLKHGAAKVGKRTPEYWSWLAMKKRCSNPNYEKYSYYGGRGIAVCARWQSFELFLADMGPRPIGHTLERINSDGDYEPANCRWATPKEQAANRRRPANWKAPDGKTL